MTTPVQAQIIQAIEKYDSIILHRHVNPDPDALGSQLGLKNILENEFNKKVYAVGESAEGLKFLGDMDEVTDDIFAHSLCIVLDTANEKRVSDDRYKLSPTVIKIDHHPNREPFGDISWVDTSFASTCEMIVDLFKITSFHSQTIEISTEAAQLLYTGFIGDTGRFLYPSTTARTLTYAALLKKYPFDANDIYNSLYSVSKNVVKAKAHLLSKFETTANGVGYSLFDETDMDLLNIRKDEAANLVNEMSYIEDVPVWVLFVQDGNEYRVRIRSSGIAINNVANSYNGGGHPLASGATVTKEEIPSLLNELNNLI